MMTREEPPNAWERVKGLRAEVERLRRHISKRANELVELRAEVERLTAALKDLRERAVEEGIHHFVNRIDAALEPKP